MEMGEDIRKERQETLKMKLLQQKDQEVEVEEEEDLDYEPLD